MFKMTSDKLHCVNCDTDIIESTLRYMLILKVILTMVIINLKNFNEFEVCNNNNYYCNNVNFLQINLIVGTINIIYKRI